MTSAVKLIPGLDVLYTGC